MIDNQAKTHTNKHEFKQTPTKDLIPFVSQLHIKRIKTYFDNTNGTNLIVYIYFKDNITQLKDKQIGLYYNNSIMCSGVNTSGFRKVRLRLGDYDEVNYDIINPTFDVIGKKTLKITFNDISLGSWDNAMAVKIPYNIKPTSHIPMYSYLTGGGSFIDAYLCTFETKTFLDKRPDEMNIREYNTITTLCPIRITSAVLHGVEADIVLVQNFIIPR